MADLQSSVEEYLAGLPDEDWRALSARVRPPDDTTPPVTKYPRAVRNPGEVAAQLKKRFGVDYQERQK